MVEKAQEFARLFEVLASSDDPNDTPWPIPESLTLIEAVVGVWLGRHPYHSMLGVGADRFGCDLWNPADQALYLKFYRLRPPRSEADGDTGHDLLVSLKRAVEEKVLHADRMGWTAGQEVDPFRTTIELGHFLEFVKARPGGSHLLRELLAVEGRERRPKSEQTPLKATGPSPVKATAARKRMHADLASGKISPIDLHRLKGESLRSEYGELPNGQLMALNTVTKARRLVLEECSAQTANSENL